MLTEEAEILMTCKGVICVPFQQIAHAEDAHIQYGISCFHLLMRSGKAKCHLCQKTTQAF